jgi:hypothetical protein
MNENAVVFELRSHSRSLCLEMLCQIFKAKASTSQPEEPDPVPARPIVNLRCPAHFDQALAGGSRRFFLSWAQW